MNNIEDWVRKYIKLRTVMQELDAQHKEVMRPYVAAKEKLTNLLLDALIQMGAEHVTTEGGTVHRSTKRSCSIDDKSAFWAFVIATADFDLVDIKANVTTVREFIEKNPAGSPPPGVKFNQIETIGVRKD
jgi:hypothetical protein